MEDMKEKQPEQTPEPEHKPKNQNEEMVYYTDPIIHAKINGLLESITSLESAMGIDSTAEEKAEFVEKKQVVYLEIKELDPLFYIRIKPSNT